MERVNNFDLLWGWPMKINTKSKPSVEVRDTERFLNS